MEKNKGNKNIVIGVLVAIICAIAVGYAALSANLTITGTTNITGTWNMEITSITPVAAVGEGSASQDDITISGTTATVAATLKKPKDSISFDITYKNSGTIAARLHTLTHTETVTSGTDLRNYGFSNAIVPDTTGQTNGTVFAAGESKTVRFTITYPDGNALPTTNARISNITLIANFVQN